MLQVTSWTHHYPARGRRCRSASRIESQRKRSEVIEYNKCSWTGRAAVNVHMRMAVHFFFLPLAAALAGTASAADPPSFLDAAPAPTFLCHSSIIFFSSPLRSLKPDRWSSDLTHEDGTQLTCQAKFRKIAPFMVTLYRKYTRALTFQNFS